MMNDGSLSFSLLERGSCSVLPVIAREGVTQFSGMEIGGIGSHILVRIPDSNSLTPSPYDFWSVTNCKIYDIHENTRQSAHIWSTRTFNCLEFCIKNWVANQPLSAKTGVTLMGDTTKTDIPPKMP